MSDRIRTEALGWDDLRYFVALAEAGSLSAAARALRVNHATVARRLAHLELSLGRLLFERRAEGYIATADGRAVLEHALIMQAAALAVLSGFDGSGTFNSLVRLTATPALISGFLVPHLQAFFEVHPNIDLELIADTRALSLERRDADIAIRFGRPNDTQSIGRRLGTVNYAFFASKRYLAGSVPFLVGYDAGNDLIQEARWMASHFSDARFAFRSNSQMAQAEAANAGCGTALLPIYLARRYPELVPVDLGCSPPSRDAWLLIRRDLAGVPRVKVVAGYVVDLFKRHRAVFETSTHETRNAII